MNLRWCRVCKADRGTVNGRFMVHYKKGTLKLDLDGKATGQTCPMSKRKAAVTRGANG